jgi:hypothetical protein
MAIHVRLRIVGVYFNEIIKIEDEQVEQVQSVYDLMQVYIKAKGGVMKEDVFNPGSLVANPGGLEIDVRDVGTAPHVPIYSLHAVRYNYPGNFKFFKGTTLQETTGATLGGKRRVAGILTLNEDMVCCLTPESVLVRSAFQYYVTDKDGKVRSATEPYYKTARTDIEGSIRKKEGGFEAFNKKDNDYKFFEDGDVVTWRLVVLNLPSVTNLDCSDVQNMVSTEESSKAVAELENRTSTSRTKMSN